MLRGRHISVADILEHLQTLPHQHINALFRHCMLLLALALAAATFFCVKTTGQVAESRHIFFVPWCEREASPPNPVRLFLQLGRPFTRQVATPKNAKCRGSGAAMESVHRLAMMLCKLRRVCNQNAGDGSNSTDGDALMVRYLQDEMEPIYTVVIATCLARRHHSDCFEHVFVQSVI